MNFNNRPSVHQGAKGFRDIRQRGKCTHPTFATQRFKNGLTRSPTKVEQGAPRNQGFTIFEIGTYFVTNRPPLELRCFFFVHRRKASCRSFKLSQLHPDITQFIAKVRHLAGDVSLCRCSVENNCCKWSDDIPDFVGIKKGLFVDGRSDQIMERAKQVTRKVITQFAA